MITYFPEIYPDELMYSWFARYYVHSGYLTHKQALQELFSKRSDTPSKEFIGNLNLAAKDLVSRLYPLDELILNHTMFPQYARFIPTEQRKEALYSLQHDNCDVHHLFCVLPRGEGEQFLRYCPMCAAEDRREYGETYWHRKHQIRNQRVCTKHRCRLLESDVTAKSEMCYTFCAAERRIPKESAVVMEENVEAVRFAAFQKAVFSAPLSFENEYSISAALYNGMRGTKYLKASGQSRNTKRLADDVKAYYEKLGLCSIASFDQIQRVLLGRRYDFSVVCQIAFFLEMKLEELTEASLTAEQIQWEQDSRYRRDKMPVDWTALDAETAPVLEWTAQRIYDGTASENGRPERVSERLVYREMGLKRHQLEKMPMCRAVLDRYTESYPESWARKLVWAYEKLKESGEPFYWSDMRKLAGVRKDKCDEIEQHLRKFADGTSAAVILKLMKTS